MNAELFKQDIAQAVKSKIAQLRRDGVVAMGADNLWQVTVSQISKSARGPTGANCAWSARQSFNEVISKQPISKFILS